MDDDFNFEELADIAINNVTEFINYEQQFIKKEHELFAQLINLDQVIVHLVEGLITDDNLHNLTFRMSARLRYLKDMITSFANNDVRLEKEEEAILRQLKVDRERKKWKAVRLDVQSEEKAEQAVIKLELDEIRKIHDIFLEIMKLMKRSKLLALDEDMTKEKKDYANKIDYYFNQIYKFIRTYERIFRHLWKKEKQLYDNLRKTSPWA